MSNPNRLRERAVAEHGSRSRCRIGLTAVLCLALFALSAHAISTEWQPFENTDDGIAIFRKETADTGLVVFRGTGTVEAPLPLVATLILNTDRRQEWIEGLDSSAVIRWEDGENFIEYDHVGLPFFIRDRDFVSQVSMSFDPSAKELIFHYRPAEDASAPRTRYIRGELTTTFILDSVDGDKKTRVDAEFFCDPKGLIPKWLVNFFLKDWPKTTFRNLRKEALKPDIAIDPHFSELLSNGTIDLNRPPVNSLKGHQTLVSEE